LAKLEASNTAVFGVSIDSPAANAAFAKQIGVTFPLLSDMNRKALTDYGILKQYAVSGGQYEWARRTTFVIDEQGRIQRIDFDKDAIDPNTAVSACLDLHKKSAP
jgi:thioredoxin-dependent peroxiredoxin